MTISRKSALGSPPLQVLLIDDDEDAYVLTRDLLAEVRAQRYVLDWAKSAASGIAAVDAGNFDVCLIDFYLGAHEGDKVIRELRRRVPIMPLILMTSADNNANDVSVMFAGADDFLIKSDTNPVALERSIRFAMERRFQEEALRSSEARFRGLFLSNIDAVIVTSPGGKVLAANPAAEKLFRLTEADIIARGRPALLAAEDESVAADLDVRLQGGGAFRDELGFRRGDGTTFVGEISVAGVGEGKDGGRTSLVIRDVSLRRATEQRALAAESRLRLAEKIAPFAAMVAIPTVVCIGVFWSNFGALGLASVVVSVQAWLLATGRTRRASAFSSLADWREQAVDARRGLTRFAAHARVDPESGLGTPAELQHGFEQLAARFQRTADPFSVALLELTDPASPRREIGGTIVQAISVALRSAASPEDTVCRIDVNTFGVLLPGAKKETAWQLIELVRRRFRDKLLGSSSALRISGGAAEIVYEVNSLQQLVERAKEDLVNYDRDLAFQVSQFAATPLNAATHTSRSA